MTDTVIALDTGAFYLDALTLTSSLTRSVLEQTDFGTGTIKTSGPEYLLNIRHIPCGPSYFSINFYFDDNKQLSSLSFSMYIEHQNATWDDYSLDAEKARLTYYEKWIIAQLGRDGTFPWGTMGAFWDPHDGTAYIKLTYAARG